jgi:parallel beta-helix repeat protein
MKKILNTIIICTLFFAIIYIFNLNENCLAAGKIIYVNEGESIQEAIDKANESDIIQVGSGTYYENLIINDSHEQQITIRGESKDDTFLYPFNENDDIITVRYTNNIVITEFTITQSESAENSCILLDQANQCTISQCILKTASSGIYADHADDNYIENNIIQDCDSAGIILSHSNDNDIVSNSIKNNGVGVYVPQFSNSNSNNIYYNDFFYNDQNAYEGEENNWDDGSEGNKWSDYAGYDSGNGIGTIEYEIPGGGTDRYPTGYFLNQEPTAEIVSILPSSPKEGDTIYFSGDGTDDGSIVGFEWKIDGSIILEGQNVQYSGLSVGNHEAKLRVKDNELEWSEWDSESFEIHSSGGGDDETNEIPVAEIKMPESASITKNYGEIVTFLGSGTDDGQIIGYEWESSIDGILSEKSYFYTSSLSIGNHEISFRVQDNDNEWSNPVTVDVEILQVNEEGNIYPTAITNGPYNAYVNNLVSFDASESYDSDGSILSYYWDFGDGDSETGISVNHVYESSGEYDVILTVTDDGDQSSSTTTTATIVSQSGNNNNGNNNNNNGNSDSMDDAEDNGKLVIPAFELIAGMVVLICSVCIIIFFKIH